MQFLKRLLGASHGVHASYTALRLRPYHCENKTEGMGKQEEMKRKKKSNQCMAALCCVKHNHQTFA